MSYDADTEFTDRKETEKKLQDIQDQIYEIESFPTENVIATGSNQIGKIRTKDNTLAVNNVPDPTVEFQHLQSNGNNEWIAVNEIIMSGDIDMKTFDIKNIDRTRYVVDSGVPVVSNDPSMFLRSDKFLQINSEVLGGLKITANNIEIARFVEVASGVYKLDMLNHSVKDAQDYTLDTSALFAIAGNSPAFAYDSASNRVILNHPTGDAIYVYENATIGTTIFKTDSVASNIITANDLLQLGVSGVTPTVIGEFRSDGTDVTVYSGGQEVNLSDIVDGSGANTALDNLTTTAINQGLVPNSPGAFDLGSELLPWRIAHLREVEFVLDAAPPNAFSDTQISKNNSGHLAFNNSTVGGGFQYYFQGDNKWGMTSTTLTGDNIILQNSLVLNDFSSDPSFNGEFVRDGDDVKVYSGGSSRNLSDIVPSNNLLPLNNIWTGINTFINTFFIVNSNNIFLGDLLTDEISIFSKFITDIRFDNLKTIDFTTAQSSVGGSGAASNTPTSPQHYAIVKLNGIEYLVPLYLKI